MKNTLAYIVFFCYTIGLIYCVTLIQDENKNFVPIKPEERQRIAAKKFKPVIRPKLAIYKQENRNNRKSYEVFEDVMEDIPVPYHLQLKNPINNRADQHQRRKKDTNNDEIIEAAESRNYQIKNPHSYEVTEEPEKLMSEEDPNYAQDNYNDRQTQIVLIQKPNSYTTAHFKPYEEKYVPAVLQLRPIFSANEDYEYKPIRIKVLKPYHITPVESKKKYQNPILIKVLKPQSEYVKKQQDSGNINIKEIENDLYGGGAKTLPKSYQIYNTYVPKTMIKYTVDTSHEDNKYKEENDNKYIYYYNEKPKPWNEYVESNKH